MEKEDDKMLVRPFPSAPPRFYTLEFFDEDWDALPRHYIAGVHFDAAIMYVQNWAQERWELSAGKKAYRDCNYRDAKFVQIRECEGPCCPLSSGELLPPKRKSS